MGRRAFARGRLAVLAVDGGGTWRLDAGRHVGKWLGRRVEVSGIRDGIDLLAVTSIRGEGEAEPARDW